MNRKRLMVIISGVLVVLFGVGFFGNIDAYALDKKTIVSKAVLEGVYQCLNGGAFVANWNTASGAEGVLLKDGEEDSVKLPYELTIINDNNLNCKEVLFGAGVKGIVYGSLRDGLVPVNVKNSDYHGVIKDYYAGSSGDGKNGVGYKAVLSDDVASDEKAQQLSIGLSGECPTTKKGGFRTSPDLKITTWDEGTILERADGNDWAIVFPAIIEDDEGVWWGAKTITSSNVEGINVPIEAGDGYVYNFCGVKLYISNDGSSESPYYHIWAQNSTISYGLYAEYGAYQPYINGNVLTFGFDDMNGTITLTVLIKSFEVGDKKEDFSSYDMEFLGSFDAVFKGFNEKNEIGIEVPGLEDYSGLALKDQEVYDLYKYYVKDVYNVPVICEGEQDYELYVDQPPINWKKGTDCRAFVDYERAVLTPSKSVYGVGICGSRGGFHFTKEILSFDTILATLSCLNVNVLQGSDEGGTLGSIRDHGGPSHTDATACYNGSGPVGWLVCPLVKIISGIGYDLWLNVRDSFMVIPANMFDDGAGLKAVWEVVRNIANILFIILFLIVIFSQLTGVGIDNYGIKKILPRLVVVAILANVSWIICELVSDVSNIVGFGIEGLLTNAASNVPIPSNSLQTTQLIVGGVGDLALAGAGGYIFVLLSGGGLIGAAALGLAVLGVVISIVSGIIIMYLILVVREIGIVLTIALAPAAIVCYALPNTEKLAKQWFNIFKALLVVFPLCGAAIGAGKLASAVLAAIAVNDPGTSVALGAISSGDFVEASRIFAAGGVNRGLMVAALVAQVVPFFLIPSLLKKSLALIGNIGAKISSAGRRASRGFNNKIDSGIRNSRGYKALEAASQSGRDMKWASRTLGKYPKNMNPDDIKSPIKRSKYIRALRMRTAYNADQDVAHSLAISKNAEEKRYGEELARMQNREDVYKRLNNAAITEGNAEEAGAAFDEMENRGGINELLEFAEDHWDDMNSDVQNRLLQKFGASKIDAFKKFNKYRSSGGTGSFHEWVRGEFSSEHMEQDKRAEVKAEISSYGASLMSREPDVMVGFDKDEFKFLNRRDKVTKKKYGLKGSIGDGQELDDALLGKMANQAMLKSNDVEARAAARKMFCEGIAEGTMRVEEAGFTAATLGKMHSSDAKALREAQAEYFKKKKLNEVQSRAEKFQDSRYEKEVDARARRYDNDNEEVQTYAQHFDGDVMKAKRQLAMEQMAADEMAVEEIQTKLAPQIANIDSIVRSNMNQESIDLLGIGGDGDTDGAPATIDGSPAPTGGTPAPTGGASAPASFQRKITPVGSPSVPPTISGSYEKVRFNSDLPNYVKNEQDYDIYKRGAAAGEILSAIGGKTLREARDAGIEIPATIGSEGQYKDYVAGLKAVKGDLDDLRAYYGIRDITFEEAKESPELLIGVKDEREFAAYREKLGEQVKARREGRTDGRFDVPR